MNFDSSRCDNDEGEEEKEDKQRDNDWESMSGDTK